MTNWNHREECIKAVIKDPNYLSRVIEQDEESKEFRVAMLERKLKSVWDTTWNNQRNNL